MFDLVLYTKYVFSHEKAPISVLQEERQAYAPDGRLSCDFSLLSANESFYFSY